MTTKIEDYVNKYGADDEIIRLLMEIRFDGIVDGVKWVLSTIDCTFQGIGSRPEKAKQFYEYRDMFLETLKKDREAFVKRDIANYHKGMKEG